MYTLYALLDFVLAANGDAGGGAAAEGARSPFTSLLPMILIFFAIMYFLMIRPNQKRERERREMLTSLSKGDTVVTTGGVFGAIVGLSDKTIVLRVSEDPLVKMEFARSAVAQVTSHEQDRE